RVMEDANPDRVEKLRHSRGVAHRGKRPGHHHPVVTGQHAGDPIVIALRERSRHLALDSFGTGGPCYPLFGSGSAGLGMRYCAEYRNYVTNTPNCAKGREGPPALERLEWIISNLRAVISDPFMVDFPPAR